MIPTITFNSLAAKRIFPLYVPQGLPVQGYMADRGCSFTQIRGLRVTDIRIFENLNGMYSMYNNYSDLSCKFAMRSMLRRALCQNDCVLYTDDK